MAYPNDINAGDTIYGYHSNVGGFLGQFFALWTGQENPFFNIKVARYSGHAFVDLDDDSDPDLVVSGSGFRYFENTGTVSNPNFTERINEDNPFGDIFTSYSYKSSLTIADLDGDGDSDFVVGDRDLRYFENIGTVANPDLIQRTGAVNPLDAIDAGVGSIPLLVDLDSDSDFDLIVGYEDGTFHYFENTGTSTSPDFTQRTGVNNPLDGITVGIESRPAMVDLDGDNDYDLVVVPSIGGYSHRYFENTGSTANPSFTERTGDANPLEKVFDDPYGTPAFVDIHGDGDLDLVVVDFSGFLYYFENTGTQTNPNFTARSFSDPYYGLTLYDNGGTDILDLRTDTTDQRVDLRPEGISDVYGLVGNLVIARDTVIEHYVAGSGNDTVIGNASANRLAGRAGADELQGLDGHDELWGGPGADTLDGGDGTDTASYEGSDAAVTIKLRDATASGGHAEGDTLTSIEHLIGSDHADTLTGDAGANRLDGGSGNDRLTGGAGADTLDGGAGIDTVSYSGSNAGVTVRLLTGAGERGHAEGDVLTNIENLIGSPYNDAFGGDTSNNVLRGGAGNDGLWGSGGDDTLIGGPGADRFYGGPGQDTASYYDSPEGVTVRLHSLAAAGGDATGDTFESLLDVAYTDADGNEQTDSLPDVEHLTGSTHNDILAGDRRDNVLDGGFGNDTLYGGPGGGDDEMTGGSGDDALYGGQGDDTLIGGPGADRFYGGPGQDTASYYDSPEGVTVRLHSLAAAGGDATGDTFESLLDVAYTDADGNEQTDSLPDVEHLTGSTHNDILAGDRRDNVLDGGFGNDTLYGGPGGGDDEMTGGSGDDALYGGQGDDTLIGGPGDDRLAGGPGADVFVFGPGEGADTVTDFSGGSDKIDLTAFDIESTDEFSMTTGDDGVTLDLAELGSGSILLADLTVLPDAGDFLV